MTFNRLALSEIDRVEFYKRDLVTTDLICCDVEANGQIWTFNEEMEDWSALLERLSELPGFRADWLSNVAKPAFATSEFIAFQRSGTTAAENASRS